MDEQLASLEKKLARMDAVTKPFGILSEEQDLNDITKYYKQNRFSYRLFHHGGGFIHLGVTEGGEAGTYSADDVLYQAKTVEAVIAETCATRTLELGSGRGANSYYLGSRNPNLTLQTVDLSTRPLLKYRNLKNMSFAWGNYHDLSFLEPESFDVVFMIETLCYSIDKGKVAREVHRLLKPGGRFIIFDGYLGRHREAMTEVEAKAAAYFARGMCINELQEANALENGAELYFNLIERRTLTEKVIPTSRRFAKGASVFLDNKYVWMTLISLVPEKVTRNLFAGYIFPDVFRMRIIEYYLHHFQKKAE